MNILILCKRRSCCSRSTEPQIIMHLRYTALCNVIVAQLPRVISIFEHCKVLFRQFHVRRNGHIFAAIFLPGFFAFAGDEYYSPRPGCEYRLLYGFLPVVYQFIVVVVLPDILRYILAYSPRVFRPGPPPSGTLCRNCIPASRQDPSAQIRLSSGHPNTVTIFMPCNSAFTFSYSLVKLSLL